MKSIYIAGPMRGIAYFNFPAFDTAAERLKNEGWAVVSPADLDRDVGFDAMTMSAEYVNADFVDAAMRRDLAALMEVDAIYMLARWRDSRGARAEYALAQWRGIEIHYEQTEGVLEEALRITSGSRRRDYDSARANHERIAGAWNWFLGSRPVQDTPFVPLSAADVASLMILLKLARNLYSSKRDNMVDVAGYARCMAQIEGFEGGDVP